MYGSPRAFFFSFLFLAIAKGLAIPVALREGCLPVCPWISNEKKKKEPTSSREAFNKA
jgi:hypothetical protein